MLDNIHELLIVLRVREYAVEGDAVELLDEQGPALRRTLVKAFDTSVLSRL